VNRLVVGLAGGVGSGKSTVAAFFRKWGARVIDADAIGHRVLERPGVRARLVGAWGPGILRDGRVDRRALASVAFGSKAGVERLNRLVHPAILRDIRRRIREARTWVVLDAALLYEAGADSLCDRVIFVRAPRELRARRTAARGWSRGEILRRERFQWPTTYKEKKAHYVINNTGPKSRTKDQAKKIYDELRRLTRPV